MPLIVGEADGEWVREGVGLIVIVDVLAEVPERDEEPDGVPVRLREGDVVGVGESDGVEVDVEVRNEVIVKDPVSVFDRRALTDKLDETLRDHVLLTLALPVAESVKLGLTVVKLGEADALVEIVIRCEMVGVQLLDLVAEWLHVEVVVGLRDIELGVGLEEAEVEEEQLWE